jgi:hypothetical protein
MPKAIEQGLISHDRGLFEALVPQMGQRRVGSLADVAVLCMGEQQASSTICQAQVPFFCHADTRSDGGWAKRHGAPPSKSGHRNFVTLITAHWTSS